MAERSTMNLTVGDVVLHGDAIMTVYEIDDSTPMPSITLVTPDRYLELVVNNAVLTADETPVQYRHDTVFDVMCHIATDTTDRITLHDDDIIRYGNAFAVVDTCNPDDDIIFVAHVTSFVAVEYVGGYGYGKTDSSYEHSCNVDARPVARIIDVA